jgi:hypothetical protein
MNVARRASESLGPVGSSIVAGSKSPWSRLFTIAHPQPGECLRCSSRGKSFFSHLSRARSHKKHCVLSWLDAEGLQKKPAAARSVGDGASRGHFTVFRENLTGVSKDERRAASVPKSAAAIGRKWCLQGLVENNVSPAESFHLSFVIASSKPVN